MNQTFLERIKKTRLRRSEIGGLWVPANPGISYVMWHGALSSLRPNNIRGHDDPDSVH